MLSVYLSTRSSYVLPKLLCLPVSDSIVTVSGGGQFPPRSQRQHIANHSPRSTLGVVQSGHLDKCARTCIPGTVPHRVASLPCSSSMLRRSVPAPLTAGNHGAFYRLRSFAFSRMWQSWSHTTAFSVWFQVYDTLDDNTGEVTCQNAFQSAVPLCVSVTRVQARLPLLTLGHTLSAFFILAILVGVQWSLSSNGSTCHCRTCIFLMTNGVDHLFTSSLAIRCPLLKS